MAATSESTLSWPSDLAAAAGRALVSVEDYLDDRWRRLRIEKGWTRTPRLHPYMGYGVRSADGARVRVLGRVLENPPLPLPKPDDNWWDNLVQMYRRFDSVEVPDEPVAIAVGGQTHRTTTGREGYYDAEFEITETPPDGESLPVGLSLPGREKAEAATGQVLVPRESARFGVVSDIDDTVLFTGVTDVATMAKLTFLHSADMRKPLPGVATLYRALRGNDGNPIFYVSSSPWNMYDLLEEFMELNDIPRGPMLLKDLGLDARTFAGDGHSHKLRKARRILETYPELPFALIGDSGQQDAELYATLAEERPDQVALILIHDVDPGVVSIFDSQMEPHRRRAAEAGVAMHRIENATEAAGHLAEAGLLDAAALPDIERATTAEREANAD